MVWLRSRAKLCVWALFRFLAWMPFLTSGAYFGFRKLCKVASSLLQKQVPLFFKAILIQAIFLGWVLLFTLSLILPLFFFFSFFLFVRCIMPKMPREYDWNGDIFQTMFNKIHKTTPFYYLQSWNKQSSSFCFCILDIYF